MSTQFITLTRHAQGSNPDTSSLQVYPDRLVVLGNLPHAANIEPHTLDDARKLYAWLVRRYPGVLES